LLPSASAVERTADPFGRDDNFAAGKEILRRLEPVKSIPEAVLVASNS
jgi:hypothetical protein